jgi:hypothetical protein
MRNRPVGKDFLQPLHALAFIALRLPPRGKVNAFTSACANLLAAPFVPMKSIRLLASLLVLTALGLIGMGVWVTQLQSQHSADAKALADQANANARQIDKLNAAHDQAIANQQASHEAAIKSLTDDFEKKLDALHADQQKKMATAFKEFESIFDGNKKTIDYINALESRVKAGQAVSKAEVEKLAIIATGISFLQKEYQKPFQDFTQLVDYLANQASKTTTKAEAGFFKRLFSREYRDAQRDYERNEATRQAFADAQAKFTTVYASAQKRMSEVQTIGDSQVKKLYALLEDKSNANTEDLSKFFDQARQALKTHQDVLDFAPDKLPDQPNKPQP